MQEKDESSVVVGDVLEAGEESLGLVEGSGESCDGSAVKEGGQGAIVEQVEADMGDLAWSVSQFEGTKHREELARLTCLDESLEAARKLADEGKGGYSWSEDLLLKHRLDDLGRNAKQLCLPKEYCQKCMSLAHEKFGHRGKQKCAEDILQYFHSPSMWRDVAHHCRSCEVCQRISKAKPKPTPMQEREMVEVPSERVALDIVDPFPKAKGGMEYLLTYIDMATRWPEAIPIRKATTGIITSKLTDIFSREGFPGVVVTNNGAQFTSKQFERYCMDHGIKQVRSAPYNPKSNGIVERMHRTLKTMIIKCLDSRGNWAELVPMVLYFMRLTPSSCKYRRVSM